MRCLQIYWRGDAMLERVLPTRDANAPLVTWFESGKTPFWNRCHQIVSVQHGEIKKISGDLDADRVLPDIFRTGPAVAVAIKSGHRIATAALEFGPENIRRHLSGDTTI